MIIHRIRGVEARQRTLKALIRLVPFVATFKLVFTRGFLVIDVCGNQTFVEQRIANQLA